MFKARNQKNLLITKAEAMKRIHAFVVTGLCVFVCGCLIWPFTANNFRSVTLISVAVKKADQSKLQLDRALARIIHEETSHERLDAIVSQIEVAGTIQSPRLEFRDHEWIKTGLQRSIRENKYGYDFRLGLDGLGGEDERQLVKMLAERIAFRLTIASSSQQPSKSGSKQSLASLHTQQAQSLELATWIVDKIDDDLKSVKITLARMGDGVSGLASSAAESNNNGTQFRLASSKRVVKDSDDVSATIDSIDLGSLREVLSEIRKQADAQANLIDVQPPAAPNADLTGPMVVGDPSQIQTRPLDNVPSRFSCCLLVLVSIIAGSVVAINFEPFESCGFENARSVGRLLGIPVIAQIVVDTTSSSSEPEKKQSSWANRAAAIAGLMLLGVCVVIAGFVLVNPEVRDAFYENPLFGCTKIIRIFAGY